MPAEWRFGTQQIALKASCSKLLTSFDRRSDIYSFKCTGSAQYATVAQPVHPLFIERGSARAEMPFSHSSRALDASARRSKMEKRGICFGKTYKNLCQSNSEAQKL